MKKTKDDQKTTPSSSSSKVNLNSIKKKSPHKATDTPSPSTDQQDVEFNDPESDVSQSSVAAVGGTSENTEPLSTDPTKSEIFQGEDEVSSDDAIEKDDEIEKLLQQNNEYENLIKNQQAEFENYRKRISKEKEDFYKYANFDLLKELLEVVDTYQRALAIETENEEVKSFLQGFKMIEEQLAQLLIRYHVKPSTEVGDEVDVNFHRTIQFEESEVHNETEVGEKIAEIYQQGYLLHERVIRLATVKVDRHVLSADSETEKAEKKK